MTANLNTQLIVPLILLGNLLFKPQFNQHLLIRCKCCVNQVSRPTYLAYMITLVLASYDLPNITCMSGTNQTSIQPHQSKFDTNGFYIVIENIYSVTMSHFKQDFVRTLKKGRRVINGLEVPNLHTIYEGKIAWNINENTSHPHRVEIPNSLYVLNRY